MNMRYIIIRKNKFTFITAVLSLLFVILSFTPVMASASSMPQINGKAAITIDCSTGEIIYASNIDKRMYPASTTKLMTALLFAENKNKNDLIKYTEDANLQPSNSIKLDKIKGIRVGDTMTADNVLKSMLIYSANDAAYMAADSVGGSSAAFIAMMNDKSKELNLKDTNFVTANGLHNNNHYTTVYELSKIARAAFKNSWIKEVMSTKKCTVATTNGLKADLENTNKLLGVDGCIGGKTGYTDEAGRCLVAFYQRNGRQILGIVFDSTYDSKDTTVFKDMETIINWSYKAKASVLYKKGQLIKTETVSFMPLKYFGPEIKINIPVLVSQDVKVYENDINKKELSKTISLTDINPWDLNASQKIGTLSVSQREAQNSCNLYTTAATSDFINAARNIYIACIGALLIIIGAITVMVVAKRRKRKIDSIKK